MLPKIEGEPTEFLKAYTRRVRDKIDPKKGTDVKEECEQGGGGSSAVDANALQPSGLARFRGNLKNENEYYIAIRCFIPGGGTAAARGYKDNPDGWWFPFGRPFHIGLGNYFDSDYGLNPEMYYGGWALGIWDPDETFDTNNRDFSDSLDVSVTENSKIYVLIKLTRTDDGEWSYEVEMKGSSETHHFCSRMMNGLCCAKTAKWDKIHPVKDFSSTGGVVTFGSEVRIGNPCAPGSYYGGPIMYDMNFKVDFNANTLEVTGHQSKFPAYEVVHGRSKVGAEKCYIHWGVAGENVWSLMDDMARIKKEDQSIVNCH